MSEIKAYTAEADIEGNRFVCLGTEDGAVKQATAGSKIIGATGFVGAAGGKTVDVNHSRLVEVQLGGTVAAGDDLISDAEGKAVKTSDGEAAAVALSSGTANAIIFVIMK